MKKSSGTRFVCLKGLRRATAPRNKLKCSMEECKGARYPLLHAKAELETPELKEREAVLTA